MKDPVLTKNGNSYERSNISCWIEKNGTCPDTRNRLDVEDLVPNRVLKVLIAEWFALHRNEVIAE
jgi:hypothetical protein